MQNKDILIFMSDQHTPLYSGFMGQNVDTPYMDRLCEEGTNFTEAYTTCPLCVPARASMLTALRPGRTGIFTLQDAIPDTTPTFLHHLVEEGYETVLCGRMHFVGRDQRHGFTKRIAKDMTPVTWTRPVEKLKEERGVFAKTFGGPWSTQVIGGGESPVIHYDKTVIEAALTYLSQPHEKPQCLVVSLYAPHFPYVAPVQLFEKYMERVKLPISMTDEVHHPLLQKYIQNDADEMTVRGALAAYCGMIELVDRQLGEVRDAFQKYCDRKQSEGIFCYTSDHGDQCGDRKMFGKETFFEKSAKIPLIFSGSGIKEGVVCQMPVSIMDLGPTLLKMVKASEMIDVDGVSLTAALQGNPMTPHKVYSEYLERIDGGPLHGIRRNAEYSYGLMLREGDYKLITYTGYEEEDLLYNLSQDPEERHNLAKQQPEVLENMRRKASEISLAKEGIRLQKNHDKATELFVCLEEAIGGAPEDERWQDNPIEARKNPEVCIKGID